MTELRISTDVYYDIGTGSWMARISRVDDIGGQQTHFHPCFTRWGANRCAKRWQRKLERLERLGVLR